MNRGGKKQGRMRILWVNSLVGWKKKGIKINEKELIHMTRSREF